jgi:hypothetical protein
MTNFDTHSGVTTRCLKEQGPTVVRSFELHVSTGQVFTLRQDCLRHRLAVPWTANCRRYHSSQSGIEKRTIRALGLKWGIPRLSQWSIVRPQTSKRRAISRLPTQAPPGASLGCLGSRLRAVRVERHGCRTVMGIRRLSSKLTGRTGGVGLPQAVSGGRWQSSANANQGVSKNPSKRWWRRRELNPRPKPFNPKRLHA